MRILVTGGTGFIGSHLVESLLKEGHQVKALIRRTSNTEYLDNLNIELVYGDITDETSLRPAVKDVQIVYHLASLLNPLRVPDDRYREVNVKGTENLLEACLSADKIERFIYCSSVAVYGKLEHIPTSEECLCSPDNIYGSTKYEGEKLALEFYHQHGLPVAVAQPAWVYGPRDDKLLKLCRAIINNSFVMIGKGDTLRHPVYVTDVVQGLKLCAKRESAIGEVYIIAGKEALPIRKIIETLADILGKKIPPFYIPAFLAEAIAWVFERTLPKIGVEPILSQRRLEFFTKRQAFSIAKAQLKLGYSPQIDLKDGLERTVEWYREEGCI